MQAVDKEGNRSQRGTGDLLGGDKGLAIVVPKQNAILQRTADTDAAVGAVDLQREGAVPGQKSGL